MNEIIQIDAQTNITNQTLIMDLSELFGGGYVLQAVDQ